MSEPAVQLPPDPMAQAGARMTELAGETARNMALRALRSRLKGVLPKVLHPLIPGERGTVAGNLQRAASRWAWGLFGSLVFSVIFFGLFGLATAGVVLVVLYAVLTSL
jgi:hypothetical protein